MNTKDLEAYELATIITITGSLLIGSGWMRYDQNLFIIGALILSIGFGLTVLFFKSNNINFI
jgi:hypothetical protein